MFFFLDNDRIIVGIICDSGLWHIFDADGDGDGDRDGDGDGGGDGGGGDGDDS